MLAAGVLLISLCLLGVHGDEANATARSIDLESNLWGDNGDWLIRHLDFDIMCDPNPCLNGGVCKVESNLSLTCNCPQPYAGKRCQSVIHVCEAVTCSGHGDCVVDLKNDPFYKCDCNSPYQGHDCSELPVLPCSPNPCQNGGSCVPQDKHFSCNCSSGFTGPLCQIAPDDCYGGNGKSYKGNVSTTDEGLECLEWNSYFILLHDRNPFQMFSNFTEEESNNHCRNPDGDIRPWCYIKRNNTLDWDYCNVKKCPGVPDPSPTQVHLVPGPSPFSECGKLSPNLLSNIVNGSKASRGYHPWQVSLQVRRKGLSSGFNHICGGTLISSCWVLTASHCIIDGFDYQVMVGGLKIHQQEASEQIIPVVETIVHENYMTHQGIPHNDIALIKLDITEGDMCAKETDYVRTACLPEQVFPAKKDCTISGWGTTKMGGGSSRALLKASVLLIKEDRCNQTDVYDGMLDSGMMCAGYLKGGTDSCQGDSGGPLTCKQDDTHYISGVVSWGYGCALKNKPGVYTNVYKFVDWVKSKIN